VFAAATFKGKRVAVFGLARSGTACIEALRLGGAEVHAWDDSAPAVEKARLAGLPVSSLHVLDFAALDALVLSPGVPLPFLAMPASRSMMSAVCEDRWLLSA